MHGDEPGSRHGQRAFAGTATLALLAAALAWTALHRGPWYDEFYTQYVTRPQVPWLTALTDSWLPDNHPPLFYILARATGWLGDIEARRLVNLAVGAATVAGGWIMVRRDARLRAVGIMLAMLLAANPWTMHAGSELRSYFISLCAGTLLALSLAAIWLNPTACGRGGRAVYPLTALVAFNTHIVTTLICGALAVPFVATAMLRRDKARLRALLPALLGAGAVFLLVTSFQLPHWDQNTRVFWLPAGLDAARWAITAAVERTLLANPLLLACGAAGAALMLRDGLRARAPDEPAAAMLMIAIGIALAFALLLGLQMIRPIVLEKYLTAASGALCVALALGCGRLLAALTRRAEAVLLLAAFIASGLALHGNARDAVTRTTWLGTGRVIAKVAARCPDTRVHTAAFWNADVMAMPPADNRRVPAWAYRRVARRLGFQIEPAGSRALSRDCPNLFWGEHDGGRRFDAATVLRHLRRGGFALDKIALYRIGDGWIASDRPLTGLPPR